MKLVFSREIFEKYSNSKFHENSPSGSPDFPCGRTWRSWQSLFVILRMCLKITKCAPSVCLGIHFLCVDFRKKKGGYLHGSNRVSNTDGWVYCAVQRDSLNVIQVNIGVWNVRVSNYVRLNGASTVRGTLKRLAVFQILCETYFVLKFLSLLNMHRQLSTIFFCTGPRNVLNRLWRDKFNNLYTSLKVRIELKERW
jgi:hypothetical protein